MRLHEYEAAHIFERFGIPVPKQYIVSSPEEADRIAANIGYPVVLKAQVLVGGRGLAGGVLSAEDSEDVHTAAVKLLGAEIKGYTVRSILVTKRVDIKQELYFGITVDGYEGKPIILVSTEGGMNVEEVVKCFPEKIASTHVEVHRDFLSYEARKLLKRSGFPLKSIVRGADILVRLYQVFRTCHALTAEINPLALQDNGTFIAVDAVLEIDDSAAFCLGSYVDSSVERNENPLERKGREIGVTYVDMDGDIGIIASGAGLGMATMDIIAQKLRPANFLETGGSITEDLLYRTMDLMMMKKGLRAVFINIYGGINPIHEGARGIVRYLKEHNVTIPVVAKALGNHQEETWEILRSGGIHVVTEVPTEKAVERLFEILRV